MNFMVGPILSWRANAQCLQPRVRGVFWFVEAEEHGWKESYPGPPCFQCTSEVWTLLLDFVTWARCLPFHTVFKKKHRFFVFFIQE